MEELRDCLAHAIMARIQPMTRVELPSALDRLRVPDSSNDQKLTKRQYIDSRLQKIALTSVVEIAEAFMDQHGHALLDSERFEFEEALWLHTTCVEVPKRVRYELARALGQTPLFTKADAFLDLVRRYWVRDTTWNWFSSSDDCALIAGVRQHLVRNDDWSAEEFFEHVGAFDVTDRRFTLFVEQLASSVARPDEGSQREFVEAVNAGVRAAGLELREVVPEGGFPVFRFVSAYSRSRKPKNLIFASTEKPDLRFRDAVDNDIEIVNEADQVLVYDRAFPPDGLRWRDLQEWWAEKHGLQEEEAKASLYRRLLAALPDSSPPQRLLFETFYTKFAARVQRLPALLPEVWLHWDPQTARVRGTAALARFRMDFLMLFSRDIRVVIEVDGRHHYSDASHTADTRRYGNMVRADRELRFSGYDVYRFGAAELDGSAGRECVTKFFESLFERHGVSVR